MKRGNTLAMLLAAAMFLAGCGSATSVAAPNLDNDDTEMATNELMEDAASNDQSYSVFLNADASQSEIDAAEAVLVDAGLAIEFVTQDMAYDQFLEMFDEVHSEVAPDDLPMSFRFESDGPIDAEFMRELSELSGVLDVFSPTSAG